MTLRSSSTKHVRKLESPLAELRSALYKLNTSWMGYFIYHDPPLKPPPLWPAHFQIHKV